MGFEIGSKVRELLKQLLVESFWGDEEGEVKERKKVK